MKRYLAALLLAAVVAVPAHAVRIWGGGKIIVQHYNSASCTSVTGLDIGDKGAVCFQTGTNTHYDWTGNAWTERSEGGGGGGDSLEWLNVKDDYGAVGDGVNDDTYEINNAVEAMEAITTGAVLFFPPGVYNVSERIGMALANPNNVILGFGAQINVVNPTCVELVCSDDESTVCAVDTDCGELDGAIFGITLADRLEIAGLRFYDSDSAAHDALGGEQTHGLVLDGVSNVHIHDISIDGMGDEALNVYGGSVNVTVERSAFSNSCNEDVLCGAYVDISKTTNALIDSNFCDGTGGPVASCFGVSCGPGACPLGTELRDIRFTNNTMVSPGASCIASLNSDGELDGLHIEGNICRDPGTFGFYVSGFLEGGGTAKRTVITGNTVEGGSKARDVASHAGGIYIIDNGGGTGVISDNSIHNFGNEAATGNHAGIYVKNGGWTVSNNRIEDSPIGIISASAAGESSLIQGNYISTVVGSGIYVSSADVVTGNFVDGATNCIYFAAGEAPGQAFANSLNNCTGTGIRLNGTDVWAVNNTIANSAVGISGSGTSPRAYNNKMASTVPLRTNGTLASDMEFGPDLDLGTNWPVTPSGDWANGTPDAVLQPSVLGDVLFRTANTAATTYDDFDDRKAGQVIMVRFSDTNTTVDFSSSSLRGNSGIDWVPVVDEWMICTGGASAWYCIISDTGTGTGDVTATASIGDEFLVRGDGAVKGVQNTGIVVSDADAITGVTSLDVDGSDTTAGYIRLKEDTDFGTNYIGLQACATDIAANFTHVLPCADAAGVLTSDGAGATSWSAAGAGDILSVGSSCASGACDSVSIADGEKLDLSAVALSAAGEGLILPQHATDCETTATWVTEGQVCWEADDDKLWIGDGVGVKEFGGGGGSGDVTDVLGCGGPDCNDITSASGVLLDMHLTLGGETGGTMDDTEGFILPRHLTCATATSDGSMCFEFDSDRLWVGIGASAKQVTRHADIDTFAELDNVVADKSLANLADAQEFENKTLTTPILDLNQTADPTADGRLVWNTTTERLQVGDDGSGTFDIYTGNHTSDTNADTICSGTSTYLDGEGNCDTIDGLEDIESATNNAVVIGNGSTFVSAVVPDCDDNASEFVQYDPVSRAFECQTKADAHALAFTVEDPGASEDISLRYFVNAVTVTSVECVSTGTTPSTTITLLHHTDRSEVSTRKCVDAQATTSTTTGDNVTLAADCTVPATSFFWLETSAASGTSVALNCTAYYTID